MHSAPVQALRVRVVSQEQDDLKWRCGGMEANERVPLHEPGSNFYYTDMSLLFSLGIFSPQMCFLLAQQFLAN